MKKATSSRSAVLCLAVLAFLIPCCQSYKAYVALEPVGRQVTPGGGLIELNGYSVNAPPGNKWGMEIDAERKTVTFFLVKRHSRAGQVLGFTLIQVFRQTIAAPEMLKMREAEIADLFRAQEERLMGEAGVTITDIKKDVTARDGKSFYALTYKADKLRYRNLLIEGVTVVSDNVLLLYFPPDFQKSHDLYGFLIDDAYRPASLATSTDISQIDPVIRSLKISPW